MGHTEEEKAASHERIVGVAAARLRESGLAGPGVAEIMAAAGLTHGGFYKHFGSRGDLVVEALERSYAESAAAVAEVTAPAADPLVAFVEWYASAEHCADPAHGCAVASLASEVSRAEPRVRSAYTVQVGRYLALLEHLLADGAGDGRPDDLGRRARAALATLVGAVQIARAIDDPDLAEQLLHDARDTVLALR